MSTNHHDPHGEGDGLTAANLNAPLGQLDDAITKLGNGTTAMTPVVTALNVATDTTLTIASGAVTRSRVRHVIDTEGAAASDDLETVSGGTEGDVLLLSGASAARVVTLRHASGNLRLAGAQDIALADPAIVVPFVFDGTNWTEISRPPALNPSTCEGRLTLTAGVPVTTADVSGATTLYFTPYRGNRVCLFNGYRWIEYAFSEISVSLAGLPDATNYDIFLADFAGTLTLVPISWTDDTTRATALGLLDGVHVKGDAPVARYLGTIRMSGVGTCEDSATKRFVWNAHHRVARPMRVVDTTDSWTYTTATWRSANNSAANRVQFVVGLVEDAVSANVHSLASNAGGATNVAVGVGIDSTSANSASVYGGTVGTGINTVVAWYRGHMPVPGFHFLQWLEISQASNTTTWRGDNGQTYQQTGLIAEGMG